MGVAIVVAGLSLSGGAQAQSWSVQFGAGPAYGQPVQTDWRDWQGQRTFDAVCSGQRAGMLEQRLRREVDEGDIDPGTAGRIHEAIDRLERQQHHECDEGDWRSVGRIAERYDGIEGWISGEARRSHWRGGW
jgi:hypothetical protein